ncbi:kinase-like domain-containing protein [Sparassis latifolia]|uniref:Negative regulator of sexual conjugation and meiosis n=1 Tax=Sparassis crispa TaxID=139825 RepID=A0A401GZT4_9APHY|nr:Negative regulator of sexual conjugation and meiosis [Sparassis crispa]GBE87649.1 Negative regulator of sexual conjugation and meiosis [Sparassis crispa]
MPLSTHFAYSQLHIHVYTRRTHIMSKHSVPNLAFKCIDAGRIQLLDVLGAGGHGTIYRARDLSSSLAHPIFYAVKVLHICNIETQGGIYQSREVHLQHCVSDHPNILTLHRVVRDAHYLYIVLDYCPGGDMFGIVSRKNLFARNDELIRSLFLQLIDAVHACHQRGIYHRDLKPENILVSRDLTQLYVADFGLATKTRHSITFGAGTTLYMSPECLNADSHAKSYDTRRGDVWALGVIFTNMVSGRSPWKRATLDDKCYRYFLDDPDFLRKMLPISESTHRILHAIFTSDPGAAIELPALRQLVENTDTFYMSQEEIAASNEHVQSAWESYRSPNSPLMKDDSDDSDEWTTSESSLSSLEDDSDDSDEHSDGVESQSLLNVEEGHSVGACDRKSSPHGLGDDGALEAHKPHGTDQFLPRRIRTVVGLPQEEDTTSSSSGFCDISSSDDDSDILITPEMHEPADVAPKSRNGSLGGVYSRPPIGRLGKIQCSEVGVQPLRRLVDRFIID